MQDAAAALERSHAGVLACLGALRRRSPGYPSAAGPPRGMGGGHARIVTPLMLRALVQNCQVCSLMWYSVAQHVQVAFRRTCSPV